VLSTVVETKANDDYVKSDSCM